MGKPISKFLYPVRNDVSSVSEKSATGQQNDSIPEVKRHAGISNGAYWTPRILSIILIAFLAMMSLDVFEEGQSAGQIAIGLFMHNIPVFILIAVLAISWKYEIVGGAVFILAGLAYIITTAVNAPWYLALSWSMIIAGPAFLIGALFLVNWKKKKAMSETTKK